MGTHGAKISNFYPGTDLKNTRIHTHTLLIDILATRGHPFHMEGVTPNAHLSM